MTRRFWALAALFGGAEAGQTAQGDLAPRRSGESKTRLHRIDPYTPANGECPVCGNMAEPYVRPVVRQGEHVPCPVPPGSSVYCEYTEGATYGAMSRTVICSRCRCHYEQDAEK